MKKYLCFSAPERGAIWPNSNRRRIQEVGEADEPRGAPPDPISANQNSTDFGYNNVTLPQSTISMDYKGMQMVSTRSTTTPKLIKTLMLGAVLHFTSASLSLANEQPTLYQTHLSKAQQGDPQSQTVLGNMYHDGFGVQRDQAQAVHWYQQAAAQDHPEGLHQLGHEYSQGHGVPKDLQKAFELFLKAAEQGHAASQHRVGDHYLNLKPQDFNKAFNWLSKSAENGYGKAQYLTGHFYQLGVVVDENLETAFKLYSKAADQGHTESMAEVATMILLGQAEGDVDTLILYMTRAAQANIIVAQYYLGEMYRYGNAVEQDLKAAYHWHKKAAEKNDPDSQFALGEMYLANEVAGQNYDLVSAYTETPIEEIYHQQAYSWFAKAAENGHPEAKEKLKAYTSSR